MYIAFDPLVSFLSIYQIEIKVPGFKDKRTMVFIIALLVRAKT